MYLSKPPSLNNKNIYLKILSKMSGLDEEKVRTLEKKLGDDFFMLFNVLSGETLKFPTVYKLEEINTAIKISKFINGSSLPLEEKIEDLSKTLKISQNKIFQLWNEYDELIK